MKNRLRDEMYAQGINQSDLAEMVGISNVSISKILDGQTLKSRFIVGIAKSLGVSPEWLETGLGEKTGLRLISSDDDIYVPSLDEEALVWVCEMIDKHMSKQWDANTIKKRAKMIYLLYDLYKNDSERIVVENNPRVIMKLL